MKSIAQLLAEDIEKWGELPYISTKKNGEFVHRSFAEVISDTRALAKALTADGISGNVMLYSPNSYEWIITDLAVMGYVGTIVPIDKEWTADDILNTLNVIDISALVYSSAKAEVIAKVKAQHPDIRYICIEEEFPQLIAAGNSLMSLPRPQNDLEQTAMILFTSGTTNRPKAIPLTQANLFNNWETLCKRTPMSTADTSYVFLPLNHVYAGVANFLYTLVSGMRIYLCSDPSLMVQEMLEIRPTIVCTVPLILNRIYAVMNDEILSMLRDIRFLYCGGSFTDPEIKRWFIENGVTLLEAYGTTETSSVVSLALPDDDNIECNGVIFENLDVRIIDPDENGIGEIIIGGGSVSKGYISRNDVYSEFDSEGFYHTGDLGYIDDKRRLYIKGRKKRMIITANGKNIYVDELEQLLMQHPAVKSAAVFEEDHHPVARLYTTLTEAEADELLKKVNTSLPKFKQIKKLYLKEEKLGGRIK